MQKKVFLNKEFVFELENSKINHLIKKGILIQNNDIIEFNNKNKEIEYLFSPKIKDFKKIKYLREIKKKNFICEDCGKMDSFHVRPGTPENGDINFKIIVCVCKECRTKKLNEKDILIPIFKTYFNKRDVVIKAKKSISEQKITIDNEEYFKLFKEKEEITFFLKIVLPPIQKDFLHENAFMKKIKSGFVYFDENKTILNFSVDGNRTNVRRYLYSESNKKCACCGETTKFYNFTIDHIIARSLGGKDSIENFVGLCSNCNTKKRDMSLIEFLCRQEMDVIPPKVLKIAHAQKIYLKIRLEEINNRMNEIIEKNNQ